jgi:hypothetical protein
VAWENVELRRWETLIRQVRNSLDRMQTQIERAKAAGISVVALQYREAEKGAAALGSLASLADDHIPDQIDSMELGIAPKWQRSLQRSALTKALKQAKAARIEAGIEPPKKKATKKKP